ncbi:MAG TPA: hypothetical protein VFE41_13895 [Acetobacteraceae bacterium]|nr:hypothetical protein [Acetobacteraceae bacterium]
MLDMLLTAGDARRFVEGLARISHTLADAGLVLAAPTGFRTLPIHLALAAARKPGGTTMRYAALGHHSATALEMRAGPDAV